MSVIRSFFTRLLSVFYLSALCCGLVCGSCGGKQDANQRWVDSVLSICDSIPEDSLVYDVTEDVISESVDEYFFDFVYAFTHNPKFLKTRTMLPLSIFDAEGSELREIKDDQEIMNLFNMGDADSYVMLLNESSQLENDMVSTALAADIQMVDFVSDRVRKLECERQNGQWMLSKVSEFPINVHPYSDFLQFYRSFSTDSVFQLNHIAQPLDISLPDEEEGGIIEGTIDAVQFPVFAPVLPQDRMMLVDYGQMPECANKVVMVKCGLASGMMDILTFKENDGNWILTSVEQ